MLNFEKFTQKIWIKQVSNPLLSLIVETITLLLTTLTYISKIDENVGKKNTEKVNNNHETQSIVHKTLNRDTLWKKRT